MKIVLLESLGVSDSIMQKHSQRLKEMGHSFCSYEKTAGDDVRNS